MASGCNEVKHGMDSVVSESGVTLNTRLLGQDIIVLPLEVSNNLRETVATISRLRFQMGCRHLCDLPSFIVDLVTKSRGIDNGQRNTGTLFVELKLWIHRSVGKAILGTP